MILAGRLGLALWSGALHLLVGLRLNALPGGSGRPLLRLAVGALVSWLLTAAAESLAAPAERRPAGSRRACLLGLAGAMPVGMLLLVAPTSQVATLVAAASPASFPGGAADVPAAAARLATALLAWGAALLASVVLVPWQAWLAHDAERPLAGRRLAVCLLACYGGVAFWVAHVQSLTGDEPHYLLAARSLVRDGDVALTNDYAEHRYREFYPSDLLRRALGQQADRDLDPHDVPGRHGERRPVHGLGLSLLLVPGYLLFGWPGAVATAVVLACLAAWQALRLGAAVVPSGGWGWAGGAAVALLSPLVAFAGSLHSEPAAMLCVTWLALRATAEEPQAGPLDAAALAALPWLHVKFLPLALLLAAFLTTDLVRRGRREWLWPVAGLVLGVATQMACSAWLYGSPWPNAPQLRAGGKYPSAFSGSLWLGLPGLLFDQQDGLFMTWPVGLLALPGIALLRRERPRAARRLLVLLGVHLLLIATYRIWRSGYAPAGRQLLPVIGLLAPFVGAGAAWLGGKRPGLLTALVALNGAQVLLLSWVPRLRYPLVTDTLIHAPWWGRLGWGWVDLVLPATSVGGLPWTVAGLYTVVALGACLWPWARGGPAQAEG